jgi:hypothetical protein
MMADFIDIVTRAFRDHQLPLRFLFTSRVEEHIRKRFTVSAALAVTNCLALHDFDAGNDLRTFYRSRFSTIYEENRRLMRNIALPWPSESDLDKLVSRSDGSFIFAFTLINFVNDGSDLPHRKLRVGLESHAGLDPLYSQVLQTAPHSPHFGQILETIVTVKTPLSIMDLGCLFQIEAGDVVHALQGVQSILNVPEDDEQPIQLFHTSLQDFLTTEARSKDFFVNPAICHLSIVTACLAVMPVHSDDDFYELGGLKFAARSWSYHLLCAIQEGGADYLFSQYSVFMMNLRHFVSQSFDSWINSMIFQEGVPETLKNLDALLSHLVSALCYTVYKTKMV